MDDDDDFKADRKEELERRLATARRIAAQPVDPLTKERLDRLIQELEAQLGEPPDRHENYLSSGNISPSPDLDSQEGCQMD